MKRALTVSGLALALAITSGATAANAGALRVAGAIWANDELYDTVITDTSFIAPPEHSTDTIYNFMMSGLAGQRSIADADQGDPDFNGGRWSVQIVTYTASGLDMFDPDGDLTVDEGLELTNEADLLDAESAGYVAIMPANFYFECPLLPRRGRN